MFDEAFFDIESLKLDKQFLCVVFGEYGNYCLLFFDITLNCLEQNMYANLLIRCDDTCVITPYLFIYLFIYKHTIGMELMKIMTMSLKASHNYIFSVL